MPMNDSTFPTPTDLPFTASKPFTVGVELELQLLHSREGTLSRDAPDLIALLHRKGDGLDRFKPEITESMIELNSSVHSTHSTLLTELRELRDRTVQAADRLNIAISGGGAHPFAIWRERRIYPTERFLHVSRLYGYLAKQFTVFGQHVHVGVGSGDAAVELTQRLAPYIPHFIALSAASPYAQGEDTSFETSRLHAVAMFPLSGHMPRLRDWQDFTAYFNEMAGYGIVQSIKDFYWDIRPKPEYGTVEVRIFDTPLTVEMAAALAALVQTLSVHLLNADSEKHTPVGDLPTTRVYGYNRFQACRFGFDAQLVNPHRKENFHLGESLLELLTKLMPVAAQLGTVRPLMMLQELAAARQNGASWMRATQAQCSDLREVVQRQAQLFRGSAQGQVKGQSSAGLAAHDLLDSRPHRESTSDLAREHREPKLALV
jgi:glutamate---cysteine ligase / carboxylate-amine ligase